MAPACPKCGWQPVGGAECPRCGVDTLRYRADLGTAEVLSSPATAPPEAAMPALPSEPPGRLPAGFWIRAAAVLIDWLVLIGAGAILGGTAWLAFGARPAIGVAAQVFGVGLGVVYPVLFHWLWGQTLGKMAVQIRVVSCLPTSTWPGWMGDGGPLSLACAIVRQVGSSASFWIFGIGYLMAGLRRDKRALHDLIAGTRVERLF